MRFLDIAKRNIKELGRDPVSLGFLLGFPLAFMLLMGFAFGGGENINFPIGIIDEDGSELSDAFVNDVLPNVSVLTVTSYDSLTNARSALENGQIRAFFVIPDGFGDSVATVRAGNSGEIILNATYDESDVMTAEQIVSIMHDVLRGFAQIEVPITIETSQLNVKTESSYLDFIAPGIIVFGLIILMPISAIGIIRDRENGFLARMLVSSTKPWEFIAAYSMSFLLIGAAQIVIFLVLASAFGMNVVGNPALAFLIFFLAAVSTIGFGMVIASIAKNSKQADPISWLIAMPLAMLSGAWFSLDFMPEIVQTFARAFPFAHAIEASRGVLIRGVGIDVVADELLFMALWGIAIFSVGVMLFRRAMMQGKL